MLNIAVLIPPLSDTGGVYNMTSQAHSSLFAGRRWTTVSGASGVSSDMKRHRCSRQLNKMPQTQLESKSLDVKSGIRPWTFHPVVNGKKEPMEGDCNFLAHGFTSSHFLLDFFSFLVFKCKEKQNYFIPFRLKERQSFIYIFSLLHARAPQRHLQVWHIYYSRISADKHHVKQCWVKGGCCYFKY